MIDLAATLVRGSGWVRMLLIAASTAVASALLMVAVAILRLPQEPAEQLFNLVGEQGLRGGTAFAITLLLLPLLLLLYQVVRLGTATRERRLAAFRVAGATPGEIRLLGAAEVGLPAAAGAIVGLAVYALLRVTFGGTPHNDAGVFGTPRIELVPTTVAPSWWQMLTIISGITLAGLVTGWRASRHVVITPLGATRRQAPPSPQPWGLVPIGAAALVGLVLVAPRAGSVVQETLPGDVLTAIAFVIILLVVLGVVSLAPWLAYRLGRWLANRSGSPATLLAARQLVADPRPAGRAAAAVGAIGLVAGGAGILAAEVFTSRGWDPFFVGSFVLVGIALLLALVVTTSTLAVHAVESLLDRRRALASLVAAGTPQSILQTAQRRAAALVALPLAATGSLLGVGSLARMGHVSQLAAISTGLLALTATLTLTWVATRIAAAAVRPWLVRATAPANLRTE